MSSCRRLLLRVCLDAFLMLNAAHALLHLAWDLHRPSLQPPPVAQSSLPCQRSGTARELCTAFSKRTMSRAEPATLVADTKKSLLCFTPTSSLSKVRHGGISKVRRARPERPLLPGWLAGCCCSYLGNTHAHTPGRALAPIERLHLWNGTKGQSFAAMAN